VTTDRSTAHPGRGSTVGGGGSCAADTEVSKNVNVGRNEMTVVPGKIVVGHSGARTWGQTEAESKNKFERTNIRGIPRSNVQASELEKYFDDEPDIWTDFRAESLQYVLHRCIMSVVFTSNFPLLSLIALCFGCHFLLITPIILYTFLVLYFLYYFSMFSPYCLGQISRKPNVD